MLGRAQILVTGGTGFIGRRVVAHLLSRGTSVRVLSRSVDKAAALFGDRVEVVSGDLQDGDSLHEACRKIHTVIHTAGLYRFGRLWRRHLLETNLEGTSRLLEAAWNCRIERFVHVSSGGVLYNSRAPVNERDFPTYVSLREGYRRSKWLGELEVLRWARRGLPVTIACPTSTLGMEDIAPTPTGSVVLDFLKRQFPFGSRTAMNFVHVDDVAKGIIALTKRGRRGERYLLGHHNLWLSDFLTLLSHASGIAAPRRELPQRLISLAGNIGEFFGASRVCSETAAYAHRQQFFDLRKSAEELKWQGETSIQTIVRDAVQWFQHGDEMPMLSRERILAETNAAAN